MQILGPERPGSQGLAADQEESGNRAILALLEDSEVREQVDLVITYRDGAYEVWSGRGMLRFRRVLEDGVVRYETLEQLGEDPLARLDPSLLTSIEEELAVSGAGEVERTFFAPEQLSYPFAHERIAQLFDSPHAPDLVVSPRAYTLGLQLGQHGALDVVQSRAPLAFAGPGVRPGWHRAVARHVDIAPTICHAMGFPTVEGRDANGRPAKTYLQRQDGRVLSEILQPGEASPKRVYLMLLDGLSHTELRHRLAESDASIPNLRSVLEGAALFEYGSIVNFPSITWPSHSTLVTGAWCGHHDVINPAYYLRAERELATPQGLIFETEHFLGDGVETLYEAFRRARGAFTAAINAPQGRGADHASLERRLVCDRSRLRAETPKYVAALSPRWQEDGHEDVYREAVADARGMAQLELLLERDPPPEFVYHEFALTDAAGHAYGPHSEALRQALDDTDARIGQVLDMLRTRDLLDGTLFVVTSDHGMAYQDVSLRANPARHLERIGMRCVTAEPMIWLRDLRVEVRRAADGRTARVAVYDADPTPGGEHRPVGGARVDAVDRPDRKFASVVTDASGAAALATPPDVPSERIALAVHHDGFNPRHLTLDGRSLAPDPRRLYRHFPRRCIAAGGVALTSNTTWVCGVRAPCQRRASTRKTPPNFWKWNTSGGAGRGCARR
jgi:hypothetical protein